MSALASEAERGGGAPIPPGPTRRRKTAFRRHPAIGVGCAILLALVFVAVAAPVIGTTDPAAILLSRRLQPMSAAHWFGTDALGRDLYSRVVYGTQVSLVVGLATALIASTLGLVIGLVAGSVRWADGILMRIVDGLMAIPSVLLAIALMAATRQSVGNVILALTVAETPRVARLVRSLVLSLREQLFVQAAIAVGSGPFRIMIRHILPNTLGPLTAQATYVCASAIIIESILSFIGAGTPSLTPSWGNIIAEGRALWQVHPGLIFFPAAFLSVMVLAVNLLGDGLRDALDPRGSART